VSQKEEKMQSENSAKEEKYALLLKQLRSVISDEDPILTNLANVVAAIYHNIEKVSWAGFYIAKEEKLFLGPFQGNVACTKINIGDGVCGASAKKGETILVPNVHEFPGHIVCDAESNSEIVTPIIYNDKIFGVLDLDSYSFSNFDEIDKEWLEKISSLISNRLNLRDFIIN
jgi:GAF domain-containing protein